MDENREHTELTSEQLFGLLANLPEDAGQEPDQPKRRCCRWLLRSPAKLHYRDQAGAEVTEYVDVRDISVLGVGMICQRPLLAGTEAVLVIPLEDNSYKVALKVAHCTQTPEGHRIGCQLLLPDMQPMPSLVDAAMLSEEELAKLGL